jgi:hypothetical protein
MAVIGDKHVCEFPGCGREFDTAMALKGHGNKHRKIAGDSSDHPTPPTYGAIDNADQPSTAGADSDYIPPKVGEPAKVVRPKVADGLVPWLSIAGLAIHRRNAYDGTVFSNGIPGFVNALDDVAQQNDALYKLLEGIKVGDSPNFRLVVAALCIIVPILANHRPDSGALRNLTGGLRMMPGSNIPKLPPRPENAEADAAADTFADVARSMVENMPEDVLSKMADAFADIPDEVKQQMMEQAATMVGGMAHPEMVQDATTEPDSGTSDS